MNTIEQIVTGAISQAEQIAADTRYSTQHKQEQIAETVRTALDTLDRTAGAEIERLEKQHAELTRLALIPFAPPIEQAAALAYVLEAIRARYTGRTGGELAAEMFSEWDMALTAGDMVTSRVYRDFLPSLWRSAGEAATPVQFEEYVERTNDALLTNDQRAAREKLAAVNQALVPLRSARLEGKITLSRVELQGNKIVLGTGGILAKHAY